MSKARLFYIDNLRIFLISLVVLLHFNITYGAPGDWYYNESESGMPEIIPQAMFNATNQAFFMGMFFFISAFFTAASVQRKNTGDENHGKCRMQETYLRKICFDFHKNLNCNSTGKLQLRKPNQKNMTHLISKEKSSGISTLDENCTRNFLGN